MCTRRIKVCCCCCCCCRAPTRAFSAFFLMELMSFLKSSSGMMLACALYLKVLGHVPFSEWVFSRLIELSIFSGMEQSSSSCRDRLLSELPLVLADSGGLFLGDASCLCPCLFCQSLEALWFCAQAFLARPLSPS